MSTTSLLLDKRQEVASKISIPARTYVSRNPSFQASVEAYRSRHPRRAEDRLIILGQLDLWLNEDPLDCINSLDKMGGLGILDQDVMRSAFESAAKGNVSAAMRLASEIVDLDARDAMFSSVFRSTITTNPWLGLALLGNLPRHLRHNLEKELGPAFGKMADPSAFKELVDDYNASVELISSGMEVWAEGHSADALSFFDSIDEARLRQLGTSKNNIFARLASRGDPDAILQYLQTQPTTATTSYIRTAATGTLLARDPSRWDELTGGQEINAFVADIAADAAVKVVVKSPESAARFLDRIPGEQARAAATVRTARQLIWSSGAQRDPTAVIAWARSIPDPIVAERIVDELRFQGVKLPKDFKL